MADFFFSPSIISPPPTPLKNNDDNGFFSLYFPPLFDSVVGLIFFSRFTPTTLLFPLVTTITNQSTNEVFYRPIHRNIQNNTIYDSCLVIYERKNFDKKKCNWIKYFKCQIVVISHVIHNNKDDDDDDQNERKMK